MQAGLRDPEVLREMMQWRLALADHGNDVNAELGKKRFRHELDSPRKDESSQVRRQPNRGSPPRRLRLPQAWPVISRLRLGSKQRTQLTLLLGDKHTDHLPAYLRHAHPTYIRNTFQPEQH